MHSLTDRTAALYASDGFSAVYRSFLHTAEKHGMLDAMRGGCAIGFSGGPDSVMLLLLLLKYRSCNSVSSPLLAIHVNHLIRDGSADKDAELSRQICEKLGVEICIRKIDVPTLAKQNGMGIEEAAREARYTTFSEIIAGRNGVDSVFLAHNATDNVETVILNMLRGSGARGMCGIPPVRDIYYRPMLGVEKADILSLLDEFGIPYAVDETNASDEYTRNCVRHNVLPQLERINPSYATAIGRLTDNMRNAYSLIESMALPVIKSIGNDERFSVEHLRGLHPAVFADVISRLVYDRLGYYPDEGHISSVYSVIGKDNFSVSLVGGDIVCQRGIFFFDKRNKKSEQDVIFKLEFGENKIPGTNVTVFVERAPEFIEYPSNIYNYSIYADVHCGIIDKSVYLRFKRDGDAYRYGGITRRLKKVFNDRGIPPFMRDDIPVICDNDGILWVVGLGVRDDAKPRKGENVCRITVLFDDSGERRLYTARNFNDENILDKKGLEPTE